MQKIRVGTRGSLLARRQTEMIGLELQKRFPNVEVEYRQITTSGDRFQGEIGPGLSTKGLFVKEIEEALLTREIDLAVHSMKDMPAEMPKGLCIAAVPKRADPRDAILGSTWDRLPKNAKVGTGSPRRCAQLLHHRPDLQMVPMRGNVDTRIRKRVEQGLDAIILACAGLDRLGLGQEIAQRLDTQISLPAPGQGALAIETREEDRELRDMLQAIHNSATAESVYHERGLMKFFAAGCAVPLAALAQAQEDRVTLGALVASIDGRKIIRAAETSQWGDTTLAQRLGERLMQQGAKDILI